MKNADYSFLLSPHIIGLSIEIILIVAVVIVICIAFKRAADAFARNRTGWKALTQRFPATDCHKIGEKYKNQDGYIRGESFHKQFLIELAHEGLLVTADFDRTPILIPWSAICDITEMSFFGLVSQVELIVDKEQRMMFTLPKKALMVIQENVPAERLHKVAILDLIRDRLLNKPAN